MKSPTRQEDLDAQLNSFAIRSFRDVADNDYIAARLCHRAGLTPQFLWSSSQAIEKYLKCILVLNRIPAPKGHSLADVLDAFTKKSPFELRISEGTRKFLSYVDTYGPHRYLEVGSYTRGGELLELDKAVWEIRRYAQPIAWLKQEGKAIFDAEIRRLAAAEQDHPQRFRILGGRLEQIVATPGHPSRAALVLQNGYFGTSRRRTVKVSTATGSENAPLWLRPELIDEVEKYVWLPKKLVAAYKELAAKRAKVGG
ncbi:MAG: HEPN domain-containing protein [Pseudomonadota bacterium]